MIVTPNNPWRSVDETGSVYWSGLDVRVYINNVYIEELVGLQHSTSQSVTPVYGYGDYTFSAVMEGTRLVQGNLTLNFKEPGYLHQLLNTSVTSDNLRSNMGGDATPTVLGDFKTSRRSKLIESIWGNTPGQTTPQYFSPILTRFGKGSPGADLLIVFGETSGKQYLVNKTGNGKVTSRSDSARAYTLVDTHFMSVEQGLDDSGKPIIESYSFIAKDIVPSEYHSNIQ